MWTKRIHYLTEVNELSDYLKKVNNFTDCIISSFSCYSEKKLLYLTIEEDKTSSDFTNSSSLVWDLKCEGVSDFLMKDMGGLSKWWLHALYFEDNYLHFHLLDGYFSFKVTDFKLGIPYSSKTSIGNDIQSLHIDYILQEFKAGMNIDETCFSFESDPITEFRFIGYSENDPLPYWAGL